MDSNKKMEFYTEAVGLLLYVCEIIKEKSDYIKNITINDYYVKLENTGDCLERTLKCLNNFNQDRKYDEDSIYMLLASIKDYFDYYIRLCDNSSPSNYHYNSKYISDSMFTVYTTIHSKLKHINKRFNDF